MATAKKSSTKKTTEKEKEGVKPKVVKKVTPPEPRPKAERPLTEKEELEKKEIKEMISNAAKAAQGEGENVKGEDDKPTDEIKEESDTETVNASDAVDSSEKNTESSGSASDTEAAKETSEQTEKSDDDSSSPLITDTVTVEKHRRLWPLLILFFLIGLIVGGVFFMTQKTLDLSHLLSFTAPTPTPSPSPTPSPTPEEVKPSEYKIKVLNGSGTPGEAAKVKELLGKSNFVVSSIGNAGKDDYTKTEIQAKKYVSEAFIEKLREKLSDTYDVSSTVKTPAGDDGVVVIIGSKKTP